MSPTQPCAAGRRVETPRERRRRRALGRLYRDACVTVSPHAAERAAELGFSPAEVLQCVLSCEQSYPSDRGRSRRAVYQRGELAVVLDLDGATVVTVLLRIQQQWEHGVHDRRHLPPAAAPSLPRQRDAPSGSRSRSGR